MNNRLSNESQHEKYLVEGMQYLQANVNNVDKAFLEFSAGMCKNIITAVGPETVALEFSLRDYQDPMFVMHQFAEVL